MSISNIPPRPITILSAGLNKAGFRTTPSTKVVPLPKIGRFLVHHVLAPIASRLMSVIRPMVFVSRRLIRVLPVLVHHLLGILSQGLPDLLPATIARMVAQLRLIPMVPAFNMRFTIRLPT